MPLVAHAKKNVGAFLCKIYPAKENWFLCQQAYKQTEMKWMRHC